MWLALRDWRWRRARSAQLAMGDGAGPGLGEQTPVAETTGLRGKNTRELPKSPLPLGRVGQTPVWLKTEEILACGDNT